jgi:hypothetical protein
MNGILSNQRTGPAGWEPKFPFDLLVAYENKETRNRALHLYDHLAQQLLDDYDFQCSWWKLDHLVNPALRQEASDAAVEANMVILSLGRESCFNREQQEWIEDWTARRPHRKSAFVVLIAGTGAPERDAAPLLHSLGNFARRAGMDFFPHGFSLNPPVAKPELPSLIEAAPRPVPASPLMRQVLQHKSPIPRWGINE